LIVFCITAPQTTQATYTINHLPQGSSLCIDDFACLLFDNKTKVMKTNKKTKIYQKKCIFVAQKINDLNNKKQNAYDR
jgi:hypothetical protein